MKNWKQTSAAADIPLREVIRILDSGAMQIVLVVDGDNRLLGTITDGDIRRGILKGISLEAPANQIMNASPTVVRAGVERELVMTMMRQKQLRHIPVLDEHGSLVGLEFLDEIIQHRDNPVVLMAGGLGSRLQSLTKDCPKPMLQVGNKPLLETILENFIEHGFHKFYISVNYMGHVIKSYFGDGSRWGVDIQYLEENQRLGTGGALSLLPMRPNAPLIVMNGDVLTKVNFRQLLEFHLEHNAQATMCVREYDFQIPYGVVKIDRHNITSIEEKPIQRFFVNAGIYVLDPAAMELIPKDVFYDMPSLFESLIKRGDETSAFPIREYWLDIGQLADYDRANGEFMQVFA